jgi:hypothetical protein
MCARQAAIAVLGLGFAAFLFLLFREGLALDHAPYQQSVLWRAIQVASLGGAALGTLAAASLWLQRGWQRLLLLPLAVFVWRIAYFPLMVFSGHVASIGEWLQALLGLPIWIYGVFLCAIATLHGLTAFASAQLLRPWRPLGLVALPLFLAVACAVSFSKGEDLRWSPDRFQALDAPVPAPVAPHQNPYLPRLLAPGYASHQRVMLVAAGLTYETIPPSPWARTVMSVLEALFLETPHGSTADRVLEHYRAYASAHPLIGCRSFDTCPVSVSSAPGAVPEEKR